MVYTFFGRNPRRSCKSWAVWKETIHIPGVQKKMCSFPFTPTDPKHVGEQLILSKIWVYSHSYWLAIFCTTNSRPGKEGEVAKYWKLLEKHNIALHRESLCLLVLIFFRRNTGCSGKMLLIGNLLQPVPRCKILYFSVQSLLLAGHFLYNQ